VVIIRSPVHLLPHRAFSFSNDIAERLDQNIPCHSILLATSK
jgi:hypothetical protein